MLTISALLRRQKQASDERDLRVGRGWSILGFAWAGLVSPDLPRSRDYFAANNIET
jgi:hypothetical protein